MTVSRQHKKVIIVSAHEGAATWVQMIRFISQTSDYEIASFHQYDDEYYRSARSRWKRLALRFKTFMVFPVRFSLNARRLARNCDCLIVVTSPFFMPFLAALLIDTRDARVIALMNDIYPEALVAKGILKRGGAPERLLNRILGFATRQVDYVVFISEHHRRFVSQQTGMDAARTLVIPVSGHSDPFLDHAAEAVHDEINITYCGTLGLMHDTDTFLRWLRHYDADNTRFFFYTSGASKTAFEAQVCAVLERGARKAYVTLGNSLGESHWIGVMKQSQVGLVFQDSGSGNVIFPSKMASILAASQAVLAVADPQSDIAQLIVQNDCGWVVTPGDAAAMDRCLQDMRHGETLLAKRRNASRLGERLFSKASVANKWIELLQRALS